MSDITLDEIKEKLQEKFTDKYFLAFTAIITFSAVIRLKYAFFEGMWVDESIHGRLAKELPQHILEYSLPDKGGAMTKRPPVYNYLLTFSNMIFGDILSTDTAVRIVSPIMGTIGVASTYVLGREIKNREVGLTAAALVSVNGIYWFLSERILMGATLTALFTATILAFYYGLEDRKYSKYAIWSWGPLIALTALTKQPGYVLGPIIVIYFLYKKWSDITDYLMTDKNLKESKLYTLFTDRNYYIAVGLFMLIMTPWMIRNMSVCQFPLCSFKTALSIASSTSGNLDVQGPLYFLTSLPGLLSLPLFGLVVLNGLEGIFRNLQKDHDLLVKKIVVSTLLVSGTYFWRLELVPLVFVSSLALFAKTDGEKLLWLTAGLGIGTMSVNATKVIRYVVFTVPAFLTLASITLWRLSEQISGQIPEKGVMERISAPLVLIMLLAPILALTYTDGVNRVSSHSFQALEPAGEWINQNTAEDARIYATSPQVRYWGYPRMPVASAGRVPDNETGFKQFLLEENVSYVMIDIYERTQPEWMNLGLPPYRVSGRTAQAIRSGRLSGQEVTGMFQPVPDYLNPLKTFGETNIPLTRQTQPKLIIYGVNRTAL